MVKQYIDNQINISDLDQYAAIIGTQPSKGARSPKLWNAVFKTENNNYKMVPLDVSKENIINLLDSLNNDKSFIGGAIAVPYKETVASWLNGNITIEASKIGAVNCLFRDNKGKLKGTNTDGEACLVTFERKYGMVKNKTIMILGSGGAGKAVSSYFANNGAQILIISRSEEGKKHAKKLKAKWCKWNEINRYINTVDAVVNCSSVGFGDQEKESPLNKKQIESLKKSVAIFDIIYQPLNTNLLKIAYSQGLSGLNGLSMNLEQAVLAYKYTVKTNFTIQEIRETMSNA